MILPNVRMFYKFNLYSKYRFDKSIIKSTKYIKNIIYQYEENDVTCFWFLFYMLNTV